MDEPIKLVVNKPDPRVIAAIEQLLEDAKAGEIRGFVILAETMERGVYTMSDGDYLDGSIFWAFEVWKHRRLHGRQGAPLPDDV